jgi:hypothetical protein
MSTQRRVTAPPDAKAEVVTDSLRSDRLGMPAGTETDSLGSTTPCWDSILAQRISLDSAPWITRLRPGSLVDLILPGIPGVGFSFPL